MYRKKSFGTALRGLRQRGRPATEELAEASGVSPGRSAVEREIAQASAWERRAPARPADSFTISLSWSASWHARRW
ncbi:hypothetical protein ACFYY1_27310 [Streptomyces sp. NPDC001890]|uniref:hypothetical protein n=1 Tax=Streptomyces sp. NPDC001890 TaxID=3364620 RepID=UPI0036C20C8E